MAGSKLIEIIQQASKMPLEQSTDLVFGTVTSMTPLKIRIDNKYEVDSTFLALSEFCTTRYAVAPNSGVKLWDGLIVGDKVRMLRLNRGQLFYVIGKAV